MRRVEFAKNKRHVPQPKLIWSGNHSWGNSVNRLISICHLEIYEIRNRKVAIATEIRENTGPSITNSAEHLWRSVTETHHHTTAFETHDSKSFDRIDIVNGKAVWEHWGDWESIWRNV